jgi:hypothetical protein
VTLESKKIAFELVNFVDDANAPVPEFAVEVNDDGFHGAVDESLLASSNGKFTCVLNAFSLTLSLFYL